VHLAAAAAKQRHLSTLLDLGLRAEDLDGDDDDDLPIMALLKALSSPTSAATAMRAPAASRLVADPLEHYDDRAPGSELLLHHHEEAQAASAYRPQPSTSAAAPAAPPPPVRVATEESDLQVQFVQQLILSSMGL